MTHEYDPNNIFAKILRGEFPAHKVYEDEHAIAFLDIMPRTKGHTLVIPKAPARNIIDIAPTALSELIVVTQRVAVAAMNVMQADGITIQQFSEAAGGQLVFHLHFHVMPRFQGVELKPHAEVMASETMLAKHASMIREALQQPA